MNGKRPSFREVADQRLRAAGYSTSHTRSKYEKARHTVVLKNRDTLDLFKGYPDKVCALLVADGNVFSLVSQDFYDLKGGIK